MIMQKCLWKLHSAKWRFNEFKSEHFNRTQIWEAVKVQSNSQVVLGTATNGATPEAYYLKKKISDTCFVFNHWHIYLLSIVL